MQADAAHSGLLTGKKNGTVYNKTGTAPLLKVVHNGRTVQGNALLRPSVMLLTGILYHTFQAIEHLQIFNLHTAGNACQQ